MDPRFEELLHSNDSVRSWLDGVDNELNGVMMANPDWCVATEQDVDGISSPYIPGSIHSDSYSTLQSSRTRRGMNIETMLLMLVTEYVSEDLNWAMGTLLLDDDTPRMYADVVSKFYGVGLDQSQGLCSLDIDGFMTQNVRFAINRKTLEYIDCARLKNGCILLTRLGNCGTFEDMRLFTQGKSATNPGTLLRRCLHTSATDCMRCCDPENTELLCHCEDPILGDLTQPLNSISDMFLVLVKKFGNHLYRRKIFDGNHQLLMSFLTLHSKSAAHASRDNIPLFKTLFQDRTSVLNSLQFSFPFACERENAWNSQSQDNQRIPSSKENFSIEFTSILISICM
eukprot:CAMPEP_0182450928 /NCGR_PEP_ID=MMETSP1172-20130603/43439_1 /TAXON_ID=708627 /ORGANISM="Timspurckia oligopyrenoides, Strain CCMP3278" /LENGTH=340 /DNA_ID=CAMNT_0024648653 /DNA_START=1 /DNA_END=1023 /DNA_ORIENTATION=-